MGATAGGKSSSRRAGRPQTHGQSTGKTGQRLINAMGSKSLTVSRMADTMGVSERTVRGWRSGERGPSLDEARKLARLLDDPEAVRWWTWPNGIDPAAPHPREPPQEDPSPPRSDDDSRRAEDESVSGPTPESAERPVESRVANPTESASRQPLQTWAAVGVVVVALLAVGWMVTYALISSDGPSASTPPPSSGAQASPASGSTPGRLEQGPSITLKALSCDTVMEIPDSATLQEETEGSLGAPTFSNPSKLCGPGPKVDPLAKVKVLCRLLSPQPSSVVPDGYWYLIATGASRGRFAAANTFLNGDTLGNGNLTNTDPTVPRCTIEG